MLITIKRQQYATMNGCVDVPWLCYCFVVLFADFLSGSHIYRWCYFHSLCYVLTNLQIFWFDLLSDLCLP